MKDTETAQEQPIEQNQPRMEITTAGDFTMFIPLAKTGDVFARGLVDVARTQIITWYAAQARRNQELAALAAKTGFQRFRDKIMGAK